jgi:aminocarboxymuconate-semialdehyde decarboxylase
MPRSSAATKASPTVLAASSESPAPLKTRVTAPVNQVLEICFFAGIYRPSREGAKRLFGAPVGQAYRLSNILASNVQRARFRLSGIDLHTHLAPDLGEAGTSPGVERSADGRLIVDGHQVGLPGLYAPDALDRWLVDVELSEAVVSIPPPFFRQGLDAAGAGAWARAANDGLTKATAGFTRLSRLAFLPLEHPEIAVREYERVRAEPGWSGVVGSAGGGSASLADASLEPLWTLLDADQRLLFLHPGESPDERLTAFYLANLLGNPVETAIAAAQLVFGDVLARFAGMRVLLAHCGGCTAGVVGRWERGVATERPGVGPLSETPREAVRRLYVDCLAHDARVVDLALETFGGDKIVLGSDWPFPMGIEDPRACVEHRGAAFVARVATQNANSALGR